MRPVKTILLVGSVGAGKTSFRQRLLDQPVDYVKTQAMECFDGVLDPPGEYLDQGRYQRALQVASYDVDSVVLVLDPTVGQSRIPPGFAAGFNREVIGVITKSALATPEQMDEAAGHLRRAGAAEILRVDSITGEGFAEVRKWLCLC